MISLEERKHLYRLGALGSGLQLILLMTYSGIVIFIGPRASTAFEAFVSFEKGAFYGLVKEELLLMLMLTLYLITFSALFMALYDHRFTLVLLATVLTMIAVTITLATHSAFSLLYLSKQYHATADPLMKAQFLAAGEAVIAQNMWHSTASYFGGFMLQGGGVIMSFAMIGSKTFRKMTIITGLAGNGLDLIQHAVHYIFPGVSQPLLMMAGPFYLIWYIAVSMDLFKLSRESGVSHDLI